MLTASERRTLTQLLHDGCGLPSAREHARLALKIDDRRRAAMRREALEFGEVCASGCSAIATRDVDDERLCERCFWRMTT